MTNITQSNATVSSNNSGKTLLLRQCPVSCVTEVLLMRKNTVHVDVYVNQSGR